MSQASSIALLIDAGNSRVKWAMLSANGELAAHGGAETAAVRAGTTALASLIDALRDDSPGCIIVSNVAGEAVQRTIERLPKDCQLSALPVHPFRSVSECGGVRNHYRDPSQLGADRFAALLGAHAIGDASGADKLVVMAGTALTIDALTSEGDFLGGSIAPGIRLMRESLARGTAQLPLVDEAAETRFARDTDSAIAQGTRDAAVGAVIQSLQRLASRKAVEIRLVVSGGAISALMPSIESALRAAPPLSSVKITIRPHLVLEGLAAFAAQRAACKI